MFRFKNGDLYRNKKQTYIHSDPADERRNEPLRFIFLFYEPADQKAGEVHDTNCGDDSGNDPGRPVGQDEHGQYSRVAVADKAQEKYAGRDDRKQHGSRTDE